MAARLAIIVPYRDRRDHLRQFVPHMRRYMSRAMMTDYAIHIVEQAPGKPFNGGMVKNIGFRLAEASADYVCFHDIDYLPLEADYSPVDCPTLLISAGTSLLENMETFFGGIVAFPKADFIRVNGYPNAYWTWGFEDTELRERCMLSGLGIKRREGIFSGLPHVHAGLNSDSSLTDQARRPRALLQTQAVRARDDDHGRIVVVEFNLARADIGTDLHRYCVET
jgi:hypothetical protein